MRHYPAFLKLDGRQVLLLGSGEVAARKAEPLRRAGAIIRQANAFSPDLLDGIVLALGADAPEAELHALSEAAQARGIPVNIVDRPELCSFISPAIIARDDITVAISTGGAAPVLARMIRQNIEALLPPLIGRVAALGARFQAAIRARLPTLPARRAFLEQAFTGAPAELALAGRQEEAEAAFAAMLAASDQKPAGMVHLVGAGPGAADLLTLRALRLLGEADVIVHDRLIGDAVLDMARRDAERIFVGKARANHCMKQQDINALLIRLAREGKRVVRLKGGDPMIFGRAGEEIAALKAAGVDVEVIPGVTAASAAAASLQTSLTERAVARRLQFITAHARDGKLPEDLDWRALADEGATTAVYMGLKTLPPLVARLLAEGLAPDTPAVIVERASWESERRIAATLANLPVTAASAGLVGPCLVLIGRALDGVSSSPHSASR